jgi:RNA polymerase sigma-70 factor, ECF subfamily
MFQAEYNECELLKRAKSSDMSALQALYENNFDCLFRYIKFKTKTIEDAEDICAETFLRAFESIRKFRGQSLFKTYLYSIARNLLKDYYKAKSRTININDADDIAENSESIVQIGQNHELERVRECLKHLNEKESEVLRLRYFAKFSNPIIILPE